LSIDDFLLNASHILGVGQKTLEDSYYMKDLPGLIKRKRDEEADDYFMRLQLSLASNNRILEDESFKTLVRNLTKHLEGGGSKQDTNKLDRHALEALRLMTNQGANKTL